MTFNEIKRHYNISDEVIQKYKDCGFCRINRENEYNDLDLAKVNFIAVGQWIWYRRDWKFYKDTTSRWNGRYKKLSLEKILNI